jgi:YgiT-type zinc finger domain-containing protein
MRCPLCRQGELQPGSSNESMSYEGTTLVVQNVPAAICNTCQEPYLDERVTQRLLEFAREASAAGVIVGVWPYSTS